ncbi:monovalent cation/H(+) antiporter subunit G [uncultured Georgenia sp.]|uniref:monovalent cation/H(+) antiporter subunit G n=1 Tax=uncultured Georgenia sp. TaxID=378209 RepID=UPI0026198F57|nr:monovalent cation/H(+) antiporter subunit G [uncultured Georgenia sp.]HLV04499.1 monovalent cation/H(+) antiporter subunit G [Actinomycetaceae bacterium]
MLDTVLDVVSAVLFLGGALLAFIAGLGILRFPDLLARMHAATKPQVLGLMLLMLGLAIQLRSVRVGLTLLLVVAFQLVTGPISAHMLSRAGYRTGKIDRSLLLVDELTEDLDRAAKLDELDRLELERARAKALGDQERDARGAAADDAEG